MRAYPHTLWLMALGGQQALHRRPLLAREEAARCLRHLTGQDFGLDADKWSEGIKANRRGLYKRRSAGPSD